MRRRRLASALLALTLPLSVAVAGLPAQAAAPATPPTCAATDQNTNCLHDPTPDITALPAPAITQSYNPKTHLRSITFVAAINPPHQTCPDGGVPYADIPCSFRGLQVSARVYVPGAKAAALTVGALPPLNTPCDFTCTVTASWGSDLRGPATIILKFAIGDLIIAQNDLSGSAYEVTEQLPAMGTTGMIHLVKSKVVYSGKLKTMTLNVAGKGGIPKSGVGGVLVDLLSSSQEANIQGGDQVCCNVGTIEVVPGTKITFHKVLPGSLSVRVLAWYGKTAETGGALFHRFLGPKNMKLAPVVNVLSAGVPVDATAVVAAVVTSKTAVTVAGITIPGRSFTRYVVVPLKADKLALKAGKGSKFIVYGYFEPAQPVDEGSPIPVSQVSQPEQMFQLLGMPDPDTIY